MSDATIRRPRAAALAAALALLLTGCAPPWHHSSASHPKAGHFLPGAAGSTSHAAKVGEPIEFELPIDPPEKGTVVLDHVTFPGGVPDGLKVSGLHAYSRIPTGGGYVVITAEDKRKVHFEPLPFKGLALSRTSSYFETVEVVAQRPGHYVLPSVDVVYRVGSTWYHQRQDWTFDIPAS
ncbi:MAG: hypothetical protein ACJ74O_02780 [Frankiaceae bacterium]